MNSKFFMNRNRWTGKASLISVSPEPYLNEVLFYNEHGKSLEGAFLKAPLDFFRISSRFSNSRYHPVLKRYRAHHGVDYAAPVGTPVYAIGSGVVIAKAFQAGGGGNYVKIKHNGIRHIFHSFL